MLAVSSTASSTTPSKSLVTLDLPPSLAPRVMNALKADPKSVDLRALAQHFYGLGERILELFEEDEVCNVLMGSWRKRAAEISGHLENSFSFLESYLWAPSSKPIGTFIPTSSTSLCK